MGRIYTAWRRRLAEHDWLCDDGSIAVGFDITVARKCLTDMACEIDRLRNLLEENNVEYE